MLSYNIGSCLEEFQKIARTSIGRESRDEWASRSVDAMWGNPANLGPKDPQKVSETMRSWREKLLMLEASGKCSKFYGDQGFSPSKRKADPEDIQGIQRRRKVQSSRPTAQPLRALGSMTNVAHKNTVNRRQGQGNADTAAPSSPMMAHTVSSMNQHDLPSEMADKAISNGTKTVNDVPITPDQPYSKQNITSFASLNIPYSSNTPVQDLQHRTLVTPNSGICSEHMPSPTGLQLLDMAATSSNASIELPEANKNASSALISGSSWPQQYINAAIVEFIQDAYVWIHRDSNNKRPVDRPPASHLVPQHRRIGVIYFLLIICGCRVEVGGTVYFRQADQFTHVNKCVMFVKAGNQPEVQEGLNWLFCALESWRTELNKRGNKELFVFDSQMISYTSISTVCGDVASKALWRSSRQIEKLEHVDI
jgi:DNA ligase 4